MEQYLDLLFGEGEGYVALASKGETWEEQQFPWPRGRNRLIRWVDQRIDEANIFVCPALRSEKRRVKGDGIGLDWLWADIDWDKVKNPTKVKAALKKLQPALVLSGTGENLHVYLELDRQVSLAEHYKLNQGLRDLLEADAKHPDNSLLRLPGTFNRKGRPVEVVWQRAKSRIWSPADLLAIPAIRDTKVIGDDRSAGDGTYEEVDVSDLPPAARRLGKMAVDEAIGRYGSRHSAVFSVAQRLIKMGLNRDEIHTLMQDFEAGLEKEADEHGYDMHRDIDRCIARHPTLEEVIDRHEDDPVWEEISEEDFAKEKAEEELRSLDKEADKIIRQRRAHQLATEKLAHQEFIAPPDSTTVLFSDRLQVEPEETKYLIDGIASVGDNITITGQYKTGKTLFVCNLVRSLAEREQFLGEFDVDDIAAGTVGFWSCEMTQNVLEDRYLRPQGFTEDGASSLVLWHLRGYGISVLDAVGKRWAINQLRSEMVNVWVIDSFARICAMAGVEANDNDQVLRLLKTLDEIKRAAGVSELFLIAHTGRGELAKERARGATVLDDWADARWVLTREGDVRFLKVEGRDVDLAQTSLKFDPDSKRLTIGVGKDSMNEAGVQIVFSTVLEHEGANKRALIKLIREKKAPGLSDQNAISEMIDEACETGWIRKKKTGRGRELAFYPVKDGEGGNADGTGVAVRTIDFTGVREHQRRVKA